jgi:hypothetical protein
VWQREEQECYGSEEVMEDIVVRMKKIWCCKGAEFARPELQDGWVEIERLRKKIAELEEQLATKGEVDRILEQFQIRLDKLEEEVEDSHIALCTLDTHDRRQN